MRINKYLSSCGIDSRRKCEALVTAGRVRVNGKVVTELATDVKDGDVVELDGNTVSVSFKKTYILLNKPKGCVCTAHDEKGRKTVLDFVKVNKRVFPVGRLDYDTEGLLLLTDDGELANKITHPKNGVKKTYAVRVEGEPSAAELKRLRSGIEYNGVAYGSAEVVVVGPENGGTRLNITISEGKNHEIKNMIESLGRRVLFLKRTAIGELRLGGLSRGEWRYLNDREIAYLKTL
ncbi:MAG: rRNA pseudouridine synthase [Clostridiales bacterium]|nr:rRNA pseudouridine synthase [Clostridiales bacterium]